MWTGIKSFLKSESGATIIEYSFILALMALATIGAFSNFADTMTNMWDHVESSFTDSVGS